jgi:Zn-dependent protease with chaperone function
MPNKTVFTWDNIIIFWIIQLALFLVSYLLVLHFSQASNPEAWVVFGWIFLLVSLPSLGVMILAQFMLRGIEQRYKRMGIRFLSWITFVVSLELWKVAEPENRNFLNGYLGETFAETALILAITHLIAFRIIKWFRNKKELKKALLETA